jgi:hypothetical protein
VSKKRFEDTSLENKDQNVNFDFGKKNVSFVIGEAKSLVLKLDVDLSNMFKGKVITEGNRVGSFVLEEDGKPAKGVLTGDFSGFTNYIIIGGIALATIIIGLVARRKFNLNK